MLFLPVQEVNYVLNTVGINYTGGIIMNKKRLIALLTVSIFLLTLLPTAAAMADEAVSGGTASVTGEVYNNVYDSVYGNVYNSVYNGVYAPPVKGWEFRGKLKVVNAVYGTLTILTKQGAKTFPVAANAQITFNGKKVPLSALKPGIEVGIKVADGKITLIRAAGPQKKPTPPGKLKKEVKKQVKKEIKKQVKKEVEKTVKKEVKKQKVNNQPAKSKVKK